MYLKLYLYLYIKCKWPLAQRKSYMSHIPELSFADRLVDLKSCSLLAHNNTLSNAQHKDQVASIMYQIEKYVSCFYKVIKT